ncbi:protein-glutamine gamma-glutamyltransferase [Paenibacillus ferrarius]|uniref:protein-glutamine gamma-glutamyltransferase n=1 Tax=Paenibacillus ferrarius TaxID=1469647 RepID=UPI003D2C981C
MIVVGGTSIITFGTGILTEKTHAVFRTKHNSPLRYHYDSAATLLFELTLRSNIVEAARALSQSGAYFADFEHSFCNPVYWDRTREGKFRLRSGASPHDAIQDIFANGTAYAFECSMAVIVVLHKGILDTIEKHHYDALFADLFLFDEHAKRDLQLIDRLPIQEAVAGDILYVQNPDYDPAIPWAKGENVVMLDDDRFFGHGYGLGVASAEDVMTILNKQRLPESTVSASFTDRFVHPDFAYFAQWAGRRYNQPLIAKIGDWIHVEKI